MKKWFVSFLVFAFIVNVSFAQDNSKFEKHVYKEGNDSMPYRVLLPLNYDAKKVYPLILFLHGAGERGNDNEKQLIHGSQLFLVDSIRQKYPAIVVFPQCAANEYWADIAFSYDSVAQKRVFAFKEKGDPAPAMAKLLKLYASLVQQYKIDKKRRYVGGLSMGAMGTFELVRRKPETFAAAFAICGGANVATAPIIKYTAWWIFHGLKDNVVDPQFSINMDKALKEAGADVKLTLYAEDGHDSWTNAFKEPAFFSWMYSHTR